MAGRARVGSTLVGGLCALLASCAGATPHRPDGSPAVRADLVPSTFEGSIASSVRSYVNERGAPGKNDDQHFVDAELKVGWEPADGWRAFAHPRLRVDTLDSDLRRFEPFEAWVEWAGERDEWKVGQAIEHDPHTWLTNPISLYNRRDFASDFIVPDRLGELMVRYGRHLGEPLEGVDSRLFLYALPVFRRTEFPRTKARFNPWTPVVGFDQDAGFDPEGKDRGLYVARLRGDVDVGRFDLVFGYGPERFPQLVPFVTPGGPELQPVYYGARTLGTGFRLAPGFLRGFTAKAETAWKDVYTYDRAPVPAPDDHFLYLVGIDRAFPGVATPGDRVVASLEYAGERGASDSSSALRPFRRDFAGGFVWRGADAGKTYLKLRGLYDVRIDEKVLDLHFERDLPALHERVRFVLKVQMIDRHEAESSIFNLFPNNTSVEVGLRWRI